MSDANVSHDLPRRHPNDTVQVVAVRGKLFVLVQQMSRMGGPCWEIPGGSYQLQQGLEPEAAAVATLQYQTGIQVPASRAHLIFIDHPWNGLDVRKNECASARVYVVFVRLWPDDVCVPTPTGSLSYGLFGIGEVGAPGFRLGWREVLPPTSRQLLLDI